jgi:raffinose/stachyose/melibiose transport system permease protein
MKQIRKFIRDYWVDVVAFVIVGILFIVPFAFILTIASKSRQEASCSSSPAEPILLLENLVAVIKSNDACCWHWNSTLLTVSSVTLIVLFSAFVAYVMQRRNDRMANLSTR